MTKLIASLIVLVVLFIGWHVFKYYQEVSNEDEAKQKQAQAQAHIDPTHLPGMPTEYQGQWEMALAEARKRGASGLRDWLKAYGSKVQDPRKAWIQLDYCEFLLREDIPEAKRLFADVKNRTPKSSPVYKRVKELEKTFE